MQGIVESHEQGESCKGDSRLHSLRCVGAVTDKVTWWTRYFVTFMDDYSQKIWVYFMRDKSEVFEKSQEWKAEVENQTGYKIKYLRSDNRCEYHDKRFMESCKP